MELTDKNFEEEVLKSELPVFVDFWGSWCPPCKMTEPIVSELEKEYDGKVKIGKLNIDKYPSVASRYAISGVPTFITIKNGKEVAREIGAKSKKQLRELIESALGS
ncbi:thioredoxin [candidate division MSBL1 archaeon SCGC-AAA261O19]|uniref:Thioredoxin n=1 Tax=candidate division MSBL1 archaeon SCGC-AAA261O19 TaxID=1698277 RepID=A0A133VFB6_9EURY|nr:thioredoxin [candidate division MSBL1 archaeon SCGC-AAA261O19]